MMAARLAVRWQILGLLTFVSLVRSIDALNFSVAAKQIMPEYGLTSVQMGVLYTAFTVGYGFFHIPGGWLADLLGPRRVLALAILWWSVFTGLTALAGELPIVEQFLPPFWAFFLIRFLVGVGEGAAYPTTSKMVANWMAAGERGLASGFVWSGAGLGYALAPPLVAWGMVRYGWRLTFYALAALGVLLAVCWYKAVRDRPEDHPRVSQQELERIYSGTRPTGQESRSPRHPPWRVILAERNILLMSVGMFCLGYVAYIYQSWFYLYLVNVRGFSIVTGGLFAAGPFVAVTLLSPLGGLVSDALTHRYGPRSGRRTAAMAGFFGSALCMYLGARAPDPYLAVILLSLGDGLAYSVIGSLWSTVMDIAGEHTGAVYGVVGMCANIGGMVAPTLTPLLAAYYGWEVALYAAALLAGGGGMLWVAIDASKKLTIGERGAVSLPEAVGLRH
jgi:ACS family glucarate transporter-like MFS transporter